MSKSKDKSAAPLTEDQIIAWLRDHPRFFIQNPEVLDFLKTPKESAGKGVVDFQHYMVERLKADRDEVLQSARDIVETTRINMNNQTRIQRAVITLLEAQNFEDFVRTITIDFPSLLDLDIVSLIVETEGDVVPQIHMQGVRAVTPGTVSLLIKDRAVVLESNIAGLEEIYGGGAGLVKSQALLPLFISNDSPPALIAFGSRVPDLFQPGQGTELVLFLGDVVERCFRRWLTP